MVSSCLHLLRGLLRYAGPTGTMKTDWHLPGMKSAGRVKAWTVLVTKARNQLFVVLMLGFVHLREDWPTMGYTAPGHRQFLN